MAKFDERDPVVLSNQGEKIFGVLHTPVEVSPAPVVVICHGFAGHKTGKYRVYVALSESLAKAGIATIRFDFRGTGDSEGEFKEMTLDEEVSDTLAILDHLKQNPRIDSTRLGMFGRSLGGAVATLTAEKSQAVKSLALWAPVFTGKQWKRQWEELSKLKLNDSQKEELMQVNGRVAGHAFYQQLFELNLESHVRALNNLPFLLIHPEQDSMVPITHAEGYMKCREKVMDHTHYLTLPKSDHDFDDIHEREHAIEETVKWFQKTL